MKTATRKVSNASAKPSNEERLVDAAIRCIEKYGVAKTFLDDIAKEANLSRPTVYRTFGSRKHLLEKVAARSASHFKERMRVKMKRYPSFAEALVLGTTESLHMARTDKVFMAVMRALGDEGLERYLLDPTGPVFAFTRKAWEETFALARTAGEMRRDVTNDELVSLICSANCIFLLRDDLGIKEQSAILRKFLLPAIIPNFLREKTFPPKKVQKARSK